MGKEPDVDDPACILSLVEPILFASLLEGGRGEGGGRKEERGRQPRSPLLTHITLMYSTLFVFLPLPPFFLSTLVVCCTP